MVPERIKEAWMTRGGPCFCWAAIPGYDGQRVEKEIATAKEYWQKKKKKKKKKERKCSKKQ
jgi:hypothetical protein